eukprot:260125-Pelagomonas_calceolata.AAC.1
MNQHWLQIIATASPFMQHDMAPQWAKQVPTFAPVLVIPTAQHRAQRDSASYGSRVGPVEIRTLHPTLTWVSCLHPQVYRPVFRLFWSRWSPAFVLKSLHAIQAVRLCINPNQIKLVPFKSNSKEPLRITRCAP